MRRFISFLASLTRFATLAVVLMLACLAPQAEALLTSSHPGLSSPIPSQAHAPDLIIEEIHPLGYADDGECLDLCICVEPETLTRVFYIVKSPTGLEMSDCAYVARDSSICGIMKSWSGNIFWRLEKQKNDLYEAEKSGRLSRNEVFWSRQVYACTSGLFGGSAAGVSYYTATRTQNPNLLLGDPERLFEYCNDIGWSVVQKIGTAIREPSGRNFDDAFLSVEKLAIDAYCLKRGLDSIKSPPPKYLQVGPKVSRLPDPNCSNPHLNGGPMYGVELPKGYIFNQAVGPGQKMPGAFGTLSDITSVGFVRTELGVILKWKPVISGSRQVQVIRPVRAQISIVGPQKEAGILYQASRKAQIQVLEYDPKSPFVKFVGEEIPLK